MVAILAFTVFIFGCDKRAADKKASPTTSSSAKQNASSQNQSPTPKPELLKASDILEELGPALKEGYEVFAIRIGKTERAKKKYFYADSKPDDQIPIVFSFWVLATKNKIILVDSGFVDVLKIKQWKVVDYVSPSKALIAAGLDPAKVTDIIVTHRHWDHIGGVSLFPKARIWMDRREFADALKKYKTKDKSIYDSLRAAKKEDRLRFVPRVKKLMPGVAVARQGKHTPNFQFVAVHNPDGIWVLASDEGALYENLENHVPTGQTKDQAESLATLNLMINLVDGKLERIIPSHDPKVFERFQKVAPGIVKISSGKKE